jgi:hypothetical protein
MVILLIILVNFVLFLNYFADRDSVFGIATRCGLNAPEFEPQCKQETFCPPYSSWLALGPTKFPIQWLLGIFLGLKQPECSEHPPPSSAEVKEKVKLYLCSSCACFGMISWNVYRYVYLQRTLKRNFIPQDIFGQFISNPHTRHWYRIQRSHFIAAAI